MDTKKIAVSLIRKFNTNNPFAIADHLSITVLYSDMKNTLGFFSKYKRSKFIHLNNNIPDNLETFVCAHELGHAICHHDINTPFLKRHTLFSIDKIEREANTFAAELLLPDELLRTNHDISLFTIAEMCGVPAKLVELKYKNID